MPLLGNIKTRSELQDDLFCLQEERDYFQSKFLEQVSEIKALKDELEKSKKEIRRLRMYLMEQENHPTDIPPDQIQTPKNGNRASFVADDENPEDDDDSNLHVAEKDDASSLTQEEMEELDEQDERLEIEAVGCTVVPKYEDEAKKEDEDVRQSAEKLLAWASYRSNMSSRASRSGSQRSHNGDHSSVMSPSVLTSGSARQSLLGKMIETMEDEEESSIQSQMKATEHFEEKKEEEPLGKAALLLEDNN